MEEYLTIEQASKIYHVSGRTIYRLFDKGLPRHQFTKHGRVLIRYKDLENFLKQTDSTKGKSQEK